MRQGWGIMKLDEVCEIVNGGTPDTSVSKYWDGENLWITPKDMGQLDDIYVYNTSRKITDAGLKNSSAKMLPINSIILSSRAPIGHLAINKKPVSTNQGCKGIIPKKNVSALYLYYFLSKSVDLLNNLGSGATFKELSSSKLATVEIPLPSFPEQQRIVSILDEAFASIARAKTNAEQNLKNAKELFESYLQSVFANKGEGWKEKTLGEVCDIIGGGTPSKSNSKFYNGSIYWATVRDMKEGIVRDTEHKITQDAVKLSSTNIIPKGNIIIATRVGLGKVCLLENDTAINQDLKGIIPKRVKELSVDFLFRWLTSISNKIIEEGTGATVQGVKLPFIKSLKIPIPPLTTQHLIIQKLNTLSAETKELESIYHEKLKDLEELKRSLLLKAFNGELKTS